MRNFVYLFLIVGFMATAVLSCKHHPLVTELTALDTTAHNTDTIGTDTTGTDTTSTGTPCDPNTVYFVNDILPIFQTYCAKSSSAVAGGCHDAGSHQKDIVLDSYANIVNTGHIEAFNPSHGKIYEVITTNDPDDKMPPPGQPQLSQDQVNMIYTWIMQGAQNNECSDNVCDTTNVSFAADVKHILQTRCLGCHSASLASGGFNFSTYQGVYAAYSSGMLHGAVNHVPGYTPMPQNGTLSDCELGLLNSWMAAGAPNN